MARAIITALHVGQGMSHLIEIFAVAPPNPKPPPSFPASDFMALIDFGGDQSASAEAVDYVVERLLARVKATKAPIFDLTIISHQDKDHLSLLKPLTAKIQAQPTLKSAIAFRNVFLGGLEWSDKSKAAVTAFFNIASTPTATIFSNTQRSDYSNRKSRATLGVLMEAYGFFFRVLISQLTLSVSSKRSTSSKIDIVRNASSSVIAIENGAQSIVLPGDATWQTMTFINDLYTAWGAKPLLPALYSLEIPHHGALRTAVQNYYARKKTATFNFNVVTTFAKNLKAPNIFASAGFQNNHGHPVLELLNVFVPFTGTVPEHTFVAYAFDNKSAEFEDRYGVVKTTQAVDTTVKSLDPVVEQNLFYFMDSSGGVTHAYLSLKDLVDMHRRERGVAVEAPSSLMSSAAQPPATVYAPAPTDGERTAAVDRASLPRRR